MTKAKIWVIIISSGVIASLGTAAIFFTTQAPMLGGISAAIAALVAILTGYALKKE